MSGGPGAVLGDGGAEGERPHPPVTERRVGQYRIIRQIGRGGMAIVHLAWQETLDRHVALKELSSFHATAPDMARRFLRESRFAGSLNHPNILTVFEYFEADAVPYIAMEYVKRGSLRPYVGRLSTAQFAGVIEGVLAGLAHAEPFGIVHRDLKPENLMVADDGRVKITDFGIAKATQSAGTGVLTASGTTMGTPTYMAPEQAMGQDVGTWTDLYSVGVMAWEHVVGRVPFHDSEVPMAILIRHLNEEIPTASDVNPDVDPDISAWIDRLLVKDPSQRAQSPAAAWDELEEIVIDKLGPRWRRGARLPSPTVVFNTPLPLTPAPFESQRAKTPEPLPRQPVDATPTPIPVKTPPDGPAADYVTFGRPPQPPPPGPHPDQPADGAPAVAPPAPVSPEPPAGTDDTGASEVGASTPPPSSPGYVTYGKPATEAEPESADGVRLTPQAEQTVAPLLPAAGPKLLTEPEAVPDSEPVTAPEPVTDAAPDGYTEPEPEPAQPASAGPAQVPEREPRSHPRAHRSAVGMAVAAAVLVGAAAGGFLAAPTSGSSARRLAVVASGPIRVSVPADWQSQRTAISPPGTKLTNEISLAPTRPAGGTFVIGTVTGTDLSLLPPSWSASASGTRPQVVMLGHNRFYRYVGFTPPGAPAGDNVYALPTSDGTVLGVCGLLGASVAFSTTCESVLGTLQLDGARPVSLGPSAGFGSQLSGVMKELNRTLADGESRLSAAGRSRDQARAARALSVAYARAASALRHLPAGPATKATAALAGALGKEGMDYGALAVAASHLDRGAYAAAGAAVAKDAGAVAAAFGELAKAGYTVR
jgi:serine/threonine protein kinase